MTNLGTLGGGSSIGAAINNLGQVVGYSDTHTEDEQHAFLYKNGTMMDLGQSGIPSFATGIDDSGRVIGFDVFGSGWIWNNGSRVPLATLSGKSSYPSAISPNGSAIVGYSSLSNGTNHAAILTTSSVTDLGISTGIFSSYALAVSDTGYIGGWVEDSDTTHHGFIYKNGTKTIVGSQYAISEVQSIDSNGRALVLYQQTLGGAYGAALYSNGTLTDLSSLVVGNTTGYNVNYVGAINGNYIAASYYSGDENPNHGFLLTAVPEPATLMALGFGLFALPRRRRPSRR